MDVSETEIPSKAMLLAEMSATYTFSVDGVNLIDQALDWVQVAVLAP